jgi:hypothetical protein
MNTSPTEPFHVFISASPTEHSHLEVLQNHLRTLRIECELWDEQKIPVGTPRLKSIQDALNRADAAILLVSLDFLASKFIQEKEVQPLLEKSDALGIKIIPVILRHCNFEIHPLARFHPAHDPAHPILSFHGERRGRVWAETARKIRDTIALSIQERRSKAQAQSTAPTAEPVPPLASSVATPAQPSLWSTLPLPTSDANTMPAPNLSSEKPAHSPSSTGEPSTPTDLVRSATSFLDLYHHSLLNNKDLTKLQFLRMEQPITVRDLYIKVRLYSRPRQATDVSDKRVKDPLAALQQRQSGLQQRQRSNAALDPLEMLKSQRLSVIVGDPGAGKTTLLKYLAIQAAASGTGDLPPVPIYLQLHEVARLSTVDLFEAAVQSLQQYHFERSAIITFLEERMATGEVVFLLDALDEAVVGETPEAAEAAYQRVAEAVMLLAKRYHQGPIVVTARRAGYFQRGQLRGFAEFEVLDFLPDDITHFIERWFAQSHDERRQGLAARLQAELRNNPRVASLAANPLLLSLLAITYETTLRDLPTNRAKLYHDCVETLLTSWDNTRFRNRVHLLNTEQHQRLLQAIAGHFHPLRLRYFSHGNLLSIIREYIGDFELEIRQASDVLREITGEQGLLREQGQGIYGFLHLTMQEYFVAEYFRDDRQTLVPHMGDPWWEEVMVLFAGQARDAGPFFVSLLSSPAQPDDIFHSKLLLAGRCLATRPEFRTEKPARTATIQYLSTLLTDTPYQLIRQQVADTLAEIGRLRFQGEVSRHLLAFVENDHNPEQWRDCVMQALASFGSEEITRHFLDRFLEHQGQADFWFQDSLAEMLNKFGNLTIAARMLDIARDEHKDHWLRAVLIELIGRMGLSAVAPEIFALLANPALAETLQASCLLCLGRLGDRAALPMILTRIAEPDTDSLVIDSCLATLSELRDRSAAPELLALVTREDLVSVAVRSDIARTLVDLGDEKLVDPIVALLRRAELAEDVRISLAEVVVKHGYQKQGPLLRSLLLDEGIPGNVRQVLAWQYGLQSDISRIENLRELSTRSGRESPIWNALVIVRALLGDALAGPDLQRLIEQRAFPQKWLEEALQGAAAVLDSAQLVRLLKSRSLEPDGRIMLARALAQEGKTELVPALCTLLNNPIVLQEVRRALCETIGALASDRPTVELLIGLLPGSDIPDDLYQALWQVCRRAGVTVIRDGLGGMSYRVIAR